jgi:hypothetical protein
MRIREIRFFFIIGTILRTKNHKGIQTGGDFGPERKVFDGETICPGKSITYPVVFLFDIHYKKFLLTETFYSE